MSAKRTESWYENRPPAARTYEALRKVFEMARCIPGSQDAQEREEWEEWLDTVEALWLGTPQPSCNTPGPFVPHPGKLIVHEPIKRNCSLCGQPGHRKTTCALNPKNIDVEPK